MKGESQSFNWLKDKIFEIPFFNAICGKEDNWDELWNSIVSNPLNEMWALRLKCGAPVSFA